MEQEKIGAFIKNRRKEKGLTQVELAEKLGVTDRSISKWENGKCMPDYSLFKSLCEELDITINELLSGEKISEEEYRKKLEENIISTFKHEEELRMKKQKIHRIIKLIIIIILIWFGYKFFLSSMIWKNLETFSRQQDYPYKGNISKITIRGNDNANEIFYDTIKFEVPEEFKHITDKAVSYYVSDSCEVYEKNRVSPSESDASLLICNNTSIDLNNYNSGNLQLPIVTDKYKLMEKYNIKDEIDLLKFYEQNKNFSPNIFTKSSDIKINYLARNYANLILPNYNKFYFLEGDIKGFLIDYEFKSKDNNRRFWNARFLINDTLYGMAFYNNNENYFTEEKVEELLSSIKELDK